ncbi:prolyl-tRNA synthetase associated domain-containing protein [Aeromonas sp. R6-2]
MDKERLAQWLATLGIHLEGRDHAPVYTCEQASALVGDLPGMRVKNLLLRESRRDRLILLVADERSPVDLKQLATALGCQRLSFASAELLERHLGVSPGAVTPLALVNDAERQVELVMERRVWEADALQCHPLVNTATWVLPRAALRQLLEALSRRVALVEL